MSHRTWIGAGLRACPKTLSVNWRHSRGPYRGLQRAPGCERRRHPRQGPAKSCVELTASDEQPRAGPRCSQAARRRREMASVDAMRTPASLNDAVAFCLLNLAAIVLLGLPTTALTFYRPPSRLSVYSDKEWRCRACVARPTDWASTIGIASQ